MIYFQKNGQTIKIMSQSPLMEQKDALTNEERMKNVNNYLEEENRQNPSQIDRRLFEMTKQSIERFNNYFI